MNLLTSFLSGLGFVPRSQLEAAIQTAEMKSRASQAVAAARRPLGKRAGFEGARISRLTADWPTPDLVADDHIRSDLRLLRARSRDLGRNNDYAKCFLGEVVSNVLGADGMITHSVVDNISFGADGRKVATPDHYARAVIEDQWWEWMQAKNCLVSEDLALSDVDALILTTLVKDGSAFVRRLKGWQGNKWRYALQLIPTDCLDIDYSVTLRDGNKVVMGVEKDVWGKTVAFYFWTDPPNSSYRAAVRRERIDASEIIHLFLPEEIGQTVGVPWFCTTITRLRQLGKFEEAAVVAARTGASKMGFFERAGTGDEYEGEGEDADGAPLSEAEPGTFEQLPIGMKFTEWNPLYPSGEYDPFRRGVLRGIAAGLRCSYNTIARDLSDVNYSSLRAGAISERDMWKMLQGIFARKFRGLIYEDWLEMALTAGAIGNLPLAKFDKFKAANHIGRRWMWVDPLKEVQAAKEALALNITSRKRIIAEAGDDRDEVFRDVKDDHGAAAQIGIDLTLPTGQTPPPADPVPPDPATA